MKLIRVSTSETVPLEDGFLWSDEFEWKPIEQKQSRAIDGSLIIQEGRKKAGRSIVLQPADNTMGWIKRRDLRKVQAWSALSEQFILAFEYQHDRREFHVIFNHEAGALEAAPVKGIPSVSDDDYYNVTLRFIEMGELYSGN
ncbi:hypothetical protein [Acinetobacter radioresistens]|uniref:hypothetical protein n=1 Tax=Acinetobacter radioresistens TaxID=40216 RepID=UPI0006195749|nr:hypothetical protein [Acinetobacter radioresistens]